MQFLSNALLVALFGTTSASSRTALTTSAAHARCAGFFLGWLMSTLTIALTFCLHKRGYCSTYQVGGPAVWEEHKDGSGRSYFYNAASGATTWKKPDSFVEKGAVA